MIKNAFGRRLACLASLATAALASVASAAPVLNIGTINLEPNTANQQVALALSGDGTIGGLRLYLQVADGTTGPAITEIEMLSGTAFAPGNQQAEVEAGPQIRGREVVSNENFTLTPGATAALVTFDTTGFSAASGPFALLTTFNVPDFGVVASTFTDKDGFEVLGSVSGGQLIVVPEPATLGALAGLALVATRRRRA